MTMHNKRTPAHRQLKARAEPNVLDAPTSTPASTPEPSPPPTSSPPAPPPSSSSKPTPSPPPPPPTTSNTPSKSPEPTPTSTSDKVTTTAETTSSSSQSSSSSLSSIATTTSTTSSKPVTTPVTTITGPPVTRTQSTFVLPETTADNAEASITPSATPSATSGISTGPIIGGVVGGLLAVAALGMIVAFFLRRWRRTRALEEDFNPDEFVRSPSMMNSEFRDGPGHGATPYRASTFDPVPPSMAQRNFTPSISGTNMAGHGAYTAAAPIQERQAYTYGQGYDGGAGDDNSDIAHGAYSSEPHPQAAYNPEVYGSYAYSTDGQYQVNQNQQSYHPYQAREYETHYTDNAAPALVAGAPAVPAGRGPARAMSDEDAYGGM